MLARLIFAASLLLTLPRAVRAQKDISLEWRDKTPQILQELEKDPSWRVDVYPPRIVRTVDLTGDGAPEAVVFTGSGASTDILSLFRLVDGKPMRAFYVGSTGTRLPVGFPQGSSVMQGDALDLLPEERSLFVGSYQLDSSGRRFHECDGNVYRWREQTQTFERHAERSATLAKEFCNAKKAELFGSEPRP